MDGDGDGAVEGEGRGGEGGNLVHTAVVPVTVVLQRSLVLAVVPVTVVPQLRCCCLSCRACRSRAAACSCRMCRKCLDKHIWLLVAAPWATHRLLAVLNVPRKFGQTELVEYATALECK